MLRYASEPLCEASITVLKQKAESHLSDVNLPPYELLHTWRSMISHLTYEKVENYFVRLLTKVRNRITKTICNNLLQGGLLNGTYLTMMDFIERFNTNLDKNKTNKDDDHDLINLESYADILNSGHHSRRGNGIMLPGIRPSTRTEMSNWAFRALDRYCKRHKISFFSHILNAIDTCKIFINNTLSKFFKCDFATPNDPIFKFFLENPKMSLLSTERPEYNRYSNQRDRNDHFALSCNKEEYLVSRYKKLKRNPAAPDNARLAMAYEKAVSSMLLPMTIAAYRKENQKEGMHYFPWIKGKRDKVFVVAESTAEIAFMKPLIHCVYRLACAGDLTPANYTKWTIPNLLNYLKAQTAKVREMVEKIDQHTLRLTKQTLDYSGNKIGNISYLVANNQMPSSITAFMFSVHTQFLRHCLGSNGNDSQGYRPMINFEEVAKVNSYYELRNLRFKFSQSNIGTGFLNKIKNEEVKILLIHNESEAVPIGTVEISNRKDTGWKVTQIRGFRNGAISPEYRKSVARLLNKLYVEKLINSFDTGEINNNGLNLEKILGDKLSEQVDSIKPTLPINPESLN